MAIPKWAVLLVGKLPILSTIIDKAVEEKYNAMIEASSKMQDVTVKALSAEIAKQAQEAQFYKDEIKKVKDEEQKKLVAVGKALIDFALKDTFATIEKNYILIPRNPTPSPLSLALAGRVANLPVSNEAKK